MTSNVLVYGGTYVASVSSSIGVNNQAFHAFDATDTFTHTAYSMYDGNGIYLGSNSTSFNASYSNSNVRGEWLQLSFPSKISINTLQLSSLTGYPSRMPRDFILAGCNQGDIKWNYIYLGSNQTYTTAKETKSFYFTNSNSYDTYRLVDYRHNTGDNFSTCITNMKLGRFNLTPTGFAACNISWRTVDVSWTGINYKDAKVSWGSNNYSNVSPFISSSNTYRLSNLTENTQYNLKLSLYNSIGSEGSSNGILTLKTLNPLISSLTSNAVGWSNFTVGWTSNAYDYVILSVPGRSNQRINAPLTTFTISNLTMPSSNQISVTPYSPFGYAGSSLTQTMYTLQPSVVMNAETNKTSTNVRINFSGTFGYAIAGFSNATSNLLTSNLPSGTTFYNFSNLMGAATYSFFVTPYAPNGVAGTRQTRLITMANPTLSSASTSNISADSLQVQWAGAGYGYAQVSWSNNGVLSNSPPIYLPSSNYTVSNLKPNTRQTIHKHLSLPILQL
jgi:hypothetical protein